MQSSSQHLIPWKAYHQCAWNSKSQWLMTFIIPFGRFEYLRALYGISSISEHYDPCMVGAFTGLTGFLRIVDDIVIYVNDASTHTEHVRTFLKHCADKNKALNLNSIRQSHFCRIHPVYRWLPGSQLQPITQTCIHSLPWPTNCLGVLTQSPHHWLDCGHSWVKRKSFCGHQCTVKSSSLLKAFSWKHQLLFPSLILQSPHT